MDVKKIAAAAIAAAMVGTISLTTAPALLNQYLLTASAASLQLSSSGDEVKQLQQYLIRLNYLKSGSDTGSFDDATEGAVKNLQKDYGLKSDGIAGNSTVSLVNGLIKGNAQVLEVEASNVNVRARANTNGKKITSVDKGQKLTYESYEENGGVKWYKVWINGTQGFICGKYAAPMSLSPVSETVDSPAATPTASTVTDTTSSDGQNVRVTGTFLYVRSSASTSAAKLTTVYQGQAFHYTKTKKVSGVTWYFIKVNENTSGWVMGSFVRELDASDVSGTLKVTGEVLNVRADADLDAQKITTLKKGQSFLYSNIKNVDGINWYYIQVNSTTQGWVLGTFVSLTQTSATTTESGSLKVTGTILNVRTSPSSSAKKLTTLKLGQTFTYSDVKTVKDVKWYYIRVNANLSGWVMGTYAYPTPNTPAAPTTTTAPAPTTTEEPTTTTAPVAKTGTLKINGTLVNVRSGASMNDSIITTVKKDENYNYTDYQDGWYFIRVSSTQSGWILGDHVQATPNSDATVTGDGSTAPTVITAKDGGRLRITANHVNVRADAGSGFARIGEVSQGDSYIYTEVLNGWYHIQLSDRLTGWVNGDYVEATPNATSTTTTATTTTTTHTAGGNGSTEASTQNTSTTQSTEPTQTTTTHKREGGTLIIISSSANVRAGTNQSSARLATVKKNESFTYTDKVDGWYYIQYTASQSGWVLGDLVQATPDPYGREVTVPKYIYLGTVTVTGKVVKLRSEPDTSATALAEAKKGEVFQYISQRDNWYYVQMANMQMAWVISDFVKASAYPSTTSLTFATEPSTTTTEAPTLVTDSGSDIGYVEVVVDSAVVYSSTSLSSNKVATIPRGKQCKYYLWQNGWYGIVLENGAYGWVLGSDVDETEDITTTTRQTTTTTATQKPSTTNSTVSAQGLGTLQVIVRSLSVHTGAGESYEKISEVSEGEIFSFDQVKGNWYHIALRDNRSGWVLGDYVSALANSAEVSGKTTASASETETTTEAAVAVTKEPTTTTTAKSLGRKVTIGTVKISSGSFLNVRKKASTSGATVGTLKNGATVVIVEKGKTWHKIEYGTGYGYVKASYIKDVKTTYESMILKYTTDYYYVDLGKTVDVSLNVGGASISYASSDEKGCAVSSKGIVTAKKEGLYTITAKSGLAIANTCVVVLREPYANVESMRISAEGTKFIADWEGGGTVLPTGEIAFYPYKDVSGHWTVGYGHAKTTAASKNWSEERAISEFNEDIKAMIGEQYLLTDERPYLTAEGATALLNADLNDGPYVNAVSQWAVRNGVKLTQTQFDALVSFCYNLGPALWQNDSNKFYLKSAIISHRSGSDANADQIIEGFCRYMKSSGKNYKGLWYRRRNEAELFLKGDYALDRENKFKLPSDVIWA